jgi:hypothetical protein
MTTIADLDDFKALDPFFRIIEKGLDGIADGDHFFDLLVENVIFEFVITVPGYPRRVKGRKAVAELYRPYGTMIVLDRCHDLAVHHDVKTGVVVLEYASEGRPRYSPRAPGHSFGGLLTQILAGRGRAAVSVAIDPAPFRGVLPLPISALRAGSVVLKNPANRHRAVPLTFDQFHYAFANAVSEDEAKSLYEVFAVPGSGEPLFQAAAANLNPWTEAKVDSKNPKRGPQLIISGELDHTVPWSIANASYKREKRNQSPTEIVEMKGRGHSLTIDGGWQEVADTALAFVKRFV